VHSGTPARLQHVDERAHGSRDPDVNSTSVAARDAIQGGRRSDRHLVRISAEVCHDLAQRVGLTDKYSYQRTWDKTFK
jgi:hypothetical protein